MAFCGGKTSSGVVLLALLYLGYNLYNVYTIFYPPSCAPNQFQNCIKPAYPQDVKLQLWIYTSTIKSSFTKAQLLYHNNSFYRTDEIKTTLKIDLPATVYKKNGTVYAHVFLGSQDFTPEVYEERYHLSYSVVPLTKHSVPVSTAFNLLSEAKDNSTVSKKPVPHWVPFLHIHSLAEDWHFDRYKVPQDLWNHLRIFESPLRYLPPLYVDRLKVTKKQLLPIEAANVTLDLLYAPVSIGKLRLWLIFASTLDSMGALGFKDKEFDDLKGIFLETNFWLFGLTIFISVFHLLFDFLAFKNDISFWRKHKTMVGLSLRTIIWRCFSQLIVFLYLMDQKSSLLVLIPTGIGSIIEFWKVTKALKISVTWSGLMPKFEFGEKAEDEKMSESIDSEAMNKLCYVLVPLVVLGAAYQLVNSSFTSWYSWVIQSLVNGVYAFGFLFMLPQLFLNYKLKSVAHLPWKAFMYKAFNTFIDDVFAFIITMPTAHRLAVFRDDVVFLVYLYQRWLYPVDKTRTNEFGQSFESERKEKEQETSKRKEKSGRRTKRKRRMRLDGEGETCDHTTGNGDKDSGKEDADSAEFGAPDSDSNEGEIKISDSGDDTAENDKSETVTEVDDSDTEEEKGGSKENVVDTKEVISDTTSAETEGSIPGSWSSGKLKAD